MKVHFDRLITDWHVNLDNLIVYTKFDLGHTFVAEHTVKTEPGLPAMVLSTSDSQAILWSDTTHVVGWCRG